jgi:hypothetical protein
MKSPFVFSSHEEEAEQSLRLAYFRGRLDLIGWKPDPTNPAQAQAVKAAADPKDPEAGRPWDAATARRHAEEYLNRDRAEQAAHRNELGVGLAFTRGSGGQVSVRYARVLAQTERARGRLLVEGQLLGRPTGDPSEIGGSLGFAAEYQDPYFFVRGGVRLVGTAAPAGGSDRIDVSPVVGLGVRAWQGIRIGAEAYVLLPVKGEGVEVGGGLTVGVEFK